MFVGTGLLKVLPTMKLLTDISTDNARPLPIRFYLYEGEEMSSRSRVDGFYDLVKSKMELYSHFIEPLDRAIVELNLNDPRVFGKVNFDITQEERMVKRFNRYLFRHSSADDLSTFFIELLMGSDLLSHDNPVCLKEIFGIIKDYKESTKGKIDKFISSIIKAAGYCDYYNPASLGNLIIFREWFSTAVERVRMLKRLHPEEDYRIVPIPGKMVNINMYMERSLQVWIILVKLQVLLHFCSCSCCILFRNVDKTEGYSWR